MNVLIAHDGSEYSDAILKDLRYAGLPSHASVTALSIIGATFEEESPSVLLGHSSHPTAVRAETEAHYLKTIIAQHFPDWYTEAEVLRGNPAQEILRVAEDRHVDLIVVGSHGRTGINRLLMGSVSASIVRNATCSVRIVHPRHKHEDHPLNILIAVDGSRTSSNAIQVIQERSFPRNTRVHLLHVIDGKRSLQQSPMLTIQNFLEDSLPFDLRRVHGMLNYYEVELKPSYPTVETQIRYGDPAAEILHYAQLEEIDSIFLGAHRHGTLDRILFGSVASTVSERADTTVEIARR
jgi:nucleotide-binding universal stress UspA family protein